MARENFRRPTPTPTVTAEAGFTIPATVADDSAPSVVNPAPAAAPVAPVSAPASTGNTTVVDVDLGNNDGAMRVTGWLVCTKGSAVGKDFRLHNGWNYIGRDPALDISLPDQRIDSAPMVKVAYDDRSRSFTVAPCEGAKNLAYLSGGALFGAMQFKAYDRLQLGETEVMLVPLCSEAFSWNEEA
ncbi:MAG: hypothetical protein IJE07_01955 [Clostridia bacterium]|nr:hypothetical protein [Clostridia bacterium]